MGRWGMHYFDCRPRPFLLKCPISAGLYSSAEHGELHSQAASVNNAPNNYVTVFGLPCEKVNPPTHLSPLCYSMQIEGVGGGV